MVREERSEQVMDKKRGGREGGREWRGDERVMRREVREEE